MSKGDVIHAIQARNHSARADFLMHFDERALRRYLERLERCEGHRGRESRWVRGEPGMMAMALAEPAAVAGEPQAVAA